jgi:Putative peptidoglycan binding domain
MADPIIKLGSTGTAVKKAQKALIHRYYLPPGTDDGIFGPVTRNRVIAYQLNRAAGEFYAFSFPLYVDGIVGPQTWFRLTPETVKKTSQGSGVRLLQEILKSFGYPPMIRGRLMATSARSLRPRSRRCRRITLTSTATRWWSTGLSVRKLGKLSGAKRNSFPRSAPVSEPRRNHSGGVSIWPGPGQHRR